MRDFQQTDQNGFYGSFGGAYIPEILYKTVENLKESYLSALLINPCAVTFAVSAYL